MTSPSIAEMIIGLLTSRYEVEPEEITPQASFEDMSLDSLALMEMALALERHLGVPIAEGTLAPAQTVDEAAAVLHSLPAA